MSSSSARAKAALDTAEEPYIWSEQIGHLLRKAHQRGSMVFQQAVADHAPEGEAQLTTMQFAVLSAIVMEGPMFQNQIGRVAAMDPATTKGVIERLAERKLVALLADPKDRRKVVIDVTKAGRKLVEAMEPVGRRISEEILSALDPVERVALIHLLKKIATPAI